MNYSVNSVSPNFGMAIKIDSNAHPVIKKQVAKMAGEKAEKFWETLDAAVYRQKDNPVNILIRKSNHRQALVAVVVDNSEEALNNNQVEEATKLFSEATKKIDQACTKGIIVKNTAARKKSNLAKKLNAAKA